MTANYSSSDLQVLSGLEPVKVRPGMYTNTKNINHIVQEAIDNSVDEAICGHADSVRLVLHQDHSVSIEDNGRGMPTDIHPEYQQSGVVMIMTRLHAGAKFSNKQYHYAGGLHGVGISVANALCRKVQVDIYREGHHHRVSFTDGDPDGELEIIDKVAKKNTGTSVHLWPDPKYFDCVKLHIADIKQVLKAKAMLCPNLKVEFVDHVHDQTQVWQYAGGLQDYLKEQLDTSALMPEDTLFHGQHQGDNTEFEWCFAWQEASNIINESYVNTIPTPTGGSHVSAFKTALVDSFRDFCGIHNISKGSLLTAQDVLTHCHFVIALKMQDPQFIGQTKEKLSSKRCMPFIQSAVKDSLSLYLNRHLEEGTQLAELFIQRALTRLNAAKKIDRKKVTSRLNLPGKLTDCTTQDRSQAELFIVEGDSASGSAKQARIKTIQAVMPIRGKILNTWEVSNDSLLQSEEIRNITTAIGVEPGSTDLSSLRYERICILADADSDGNHIATLLCALFYKHYLPLVTAGHLFVTMPPLYRIDVGKQVFYALNNEDRDKILQQAHDQKVHIQRFKGLGEMNPLQLRETAMHPESRYLVQMTVEDQALTSDVFDKLLAKKRASCRKQWLEVHETA